MSGGGGAASSPLVPMEPRIALWLGDMRIDPSITVRRGRAGLCRVI